MGKGMGDAPQAISVAQAAAVLGVSEARVRYLIAHGRLRAQRQGGRWSIDATSLPSTPRRSRPMSTRIAWALIAMSQGRTPAWIGADEAYRLRSRPRRLAADPAPETLLRSWLAARAQRVVLACARPAALRLDPRITLAGISDPRYRAASASDVEAYVTADQASGVVTDHHLTAPAGHANVVLHVGPILPASPAPDLLVAADLADHDTPRELERARSLIGSVLEHWPAPVGGLTPAGQPRADAVAPVPAGRPTRSMRRGAPRGLDLLIPWDAEPWRADVREPLAPR